LGGALLRVGPFLPPPTPPCGGNAHGGLLCPRRLWARDRKDAISMSGKGIRRQCFIESAIPRTSKIPRTNPVLPHHLLTVLVPHDDVLLVNLDRRLIRLVVMLRILDHLHLVLTSI